MIEPLRRRTRARVAEVSKLPDEVERVIPVAELARRGLQPHAERVDVACARLRRLWVVHRRGGLRTGVAREEIHIEAMLRNLRRRGIDTGEPVVVVGDVEMAVL